MKLVNISILLLAAISIADAGPTFKGNGDIVDWYDCSGKEVGNYAHPYDCTMFISCVPQSVAYEMYCASCEGDPKRCPYGRNVYDEAQDQCLWADETTCSVRGSTTVPPLPSTTRQTEAPPGPTTTQPPTPPPTTKPPPTESPKPGDPCDPDICKSVGNCQTYLRCDKDTKRLVQDDCGEGLFWNPLNPDGSQQIHGGNCDFLANLSPELQQQYREDPECLACFWKALGDCEKEYQYQPPNQTTRNVLTLRCSEGLLFSQDKLTCQRCSDVRRANGSVCCGDKEDIPIRPIRPGPQP